MSGSDAPRISVLLPAYNVSNTLDDALESIRTQDFVDWELLIVDDGSTDGTRSVALDFAASEPRARVVALDRNIGIGACLNRALGESRGALIARMDADDIAVPSRFTRQVEFLGAHPDVALLGGGAHEVDGAGAVLSQMCRPEHHEDLSARIFLENPFIHPTVMLRRAVLEQLGGYDVRLRRGEDYDLWLRAHRRFRMHNLAEPLIWYRRNAPTWRDARCSARVIAAALHREGRLWQAPWLVGRPFLATAVKLLKNRPGGAPDAVRAPTRFDPLPPSGSRASNETTPGSHAPSVSVLLAAYNASDTLGAALESIRAQDFADWELLIVDDGSTDVTRSVALDFAASEPRARVIALDGNIGLPASLNRALGESRGALIARMDADDIALPSRLTRQVEFLGAHPDVAILGGGAHEINGAGAVLSQLHRPEHHEDLSARIFRENPFIHPTVMVRRAVLEQLGGYDVRLRRGQDYDLWLRAHRRFRMHNLAEPLIWYRRRNAPTWRDARFSARVIVAALHREGRLWQAPWLVGRPLLATALELLWNRRRGAPDAA